MHGAGNDFIIVDARADPALREALSPGVIAVLADRRTGIGCDQFIMLTDGPSGSEVFMRIHNADGSEAGACGNATRCVASLLHAEHGRSTLAIATVSGVLEARVENGLIEVDMGNPRLGWADIPLREAADTLHLPMQGDPAAASMGNPHVTLFVADINTVPVATLGPVLERHKLFPDRANVGFAQVLAPDRIRLRVWERGAGLTRACGSGACAALVNAHRRGLAGRRATLVLDGGELRIVWRDDGHVLMAGPAAQAFQGTVDLSTYAA